MEPIDSRVPAEYIVIGRFISSRVFLCAQLEFLQKNPGRVSYISV